MSGHDLFLIFDGVGRSDVRDVKRELSRLGVYAFMDESDTEGAWGPAIQGSLTSAPALVVLLPRDPRLSSFVQHEIQLAQQRFNTEGTPLLVLAEDIGGTQALGGIYGLPSQQWVAWDRTVPRQTAVNISRFLTQNGLARSGASRQLPANAAPRDCLLRIVVGDLLQQGVDVGILSSEYFDTDTDTAIHESSLKAWLTRTWFAGDRVVLDQQISAFLDMKGIAGIHDPDKRFGKTEKFPASTSCVVRSENRRAYIVVGTEMDPRDSHTSTHPELLWSSLCSLWRSKRRCDPTSPIAVGCWGSGLGRSSLSRAQAANLVLQSFVVMSRELGHICPEVRIVVWTPEFNEDEFGTMFDCMHALPVG